MIVWSSLRASASSRWPGRIVWAALALIAGVAAGLLPPTLSATALALIVLVVLCLIDLRVALTAVLVISPLKTLIETESHLTLPLDVGQMMFAAVIAIWLARSIAAKRYPGLGIPWTPVYVPLTLFLIAASFSLWNAISPGTALSELAKWVEMLLMVGLVTALIREGLAAGHGNVQWVVGAVLLAACVQSLIGLYEFRGGSGAAHLWILDYRYFRAFGSFGQPNPFGAFMGLTLPLALGATYGSALEAWHAYRGKQALRLILTRLALYGAAAVLLAVGLVISWSRGAWIGFAVAAMMLLVFLPPRRRIGLVLAAIILIGGLGGAVAGVLPASLVARFSDFAQDLSGFEDVRGQVISDANYAVLERFAHWQAALSMASDAPWLGVGFGNYEFAYPRYELMNWKYALGHAHNYFLNLLAETGIVGLLGYVIAWLGIVALTLRCTARQRGFARTVAVGLLAVWTHLTVHSLFDKLYVNNLYLHLGAMLGLIGGLLFFTQPDRSTAVPEPLSDVIRGVYD